MRTDARAPVNPGRRRLLAMLGLGGAAGLLGAESARGGHDGTNVLHLGEGNSVPAGRKTRVASNIDAFSFDIDNFNTGLAGALSAKSHGGYPGLQASAIGDGFAGVVGLSSSSDDEEGMGRGANTGVQGRSGTGRGVQGVSDEGAGVSGESSAGVGVEGQSATGTGVIGRHIGAPSDNGDELSAGVFGYSEQATGVRARSDNSVAIEASSPNGHGLVAFAGTPGTGPDVAAVLGLGFSGHGVHGQTERSDRAGVHGEATGCLERGPCDPGTGTGVLGTSEAGVGVEARSDTGMALKVSGPAEFATAGAGVVPTGAAAVFVAAPSVTAASHITVTLSSDPGRRTVRWVERDPGNGFTVHMTAAQPRQRPQTAFTYLVVEPV